MTKKKATGKNEVVSWQDMMATEAKEVAKTERPAVGRISLQSGIMAYEGTPVPDNEMTCIVAAVIEEQVYYDQPYEAGVVNPPACFAYGEPGSGLRAHEAVPDRDWEHWGHCDACIMNQWRKPPKKGKPCGNRRKLAILPGDITAEEMTAAEIAVLSLPVMSVKNWGTYVNILSAQHQATCWGVMTKVMVRPDARSQFRVHFEFVALLDEAIIGAVHSKIDLCKATLAVPYDLSPKEETEDSGKY
jgi:hypothetical protein